MTRNSKSPLLPVAVLLISLMSASADADRRLSRNGFVVDDALIPTADILVGGPPRDGIPAITNPKFIPVEHVTYLKDEDRLIGIVIDGEARGYPIKILDHHELVNDQIGRQHFVVSYCPLCGTGMVFGANIGADQALEFGVSGLLYNNDVLLYDRNTGSLWSQILKKSVSGKLKGTELPQLPALHTSFADWKFKHPDSKILSNDTGYKKNYARNPYRGYAQSKRIWFKVSHKAPKKYHPKEQVLGVEINAQSKAYPFVELAKKIPTALWRSHPASPSPVTRSAAGASSPTRRTKVTGPLLRR